MNLLSPIQTFPLILRLPPKDNILHRLSPKEQPCPSSLQMPSDAALYGDCLQLTIPDRHVLSGVEGSSGRAEGTIDRDRRNTMICWWSKR